LGAYTISALQNRDYPVIQGSVLIMSTILALVLLIVDVIFAIVDPRIRSQYSGRRKKPEKEEATPEKEGAIA
jgi:peptide/nickel transport system permease protein